MFYIEVGDPNLNLHLSHKLLNFGALKPYAPAPSPSSHSQLLGTSCLSKAVPKKIRHKLPDLDLQGKSPGDFSNFSNLDVVVKLDPFPQVEVNINIYIFETTTQIMYEYSIPI